MPPPTLSLSMMTFHAGPLMSVEAEATSFAPGAMNGACDRPVEADLVLSLVREPEAIVLDLYREPTRRAG